MLLRSLIAGALALAPILPATAAPAHPPACARLACVGLACRIVQVPAAPLRAAAPARDRAPRRAGRGR